MAQNSFRAKVFSKYTAAVQSCAVSFTNTRSYLRSEKGITYQIRFAPQLLKKPINPASPSVPKKPRIDPFENPDERLYVCPIAGSSEDSHYVVLNKFPVIPAHFILSTKKFENQAGPLTVDDFNAVGEIFTSWYDENEAKLPSAVRHAGTDTVGGGHHHIGETAIGDADVTQRTELYGFFNCGDDSGASQPHRHLQFLTLSSEEADDLFITKYLSASFSSDSSPSSQQDQDMTVVSHPDAPFVHYIIPYPSTTSPSGEFLLSVYRTLLSKVSHVKSYNLAFTRRWMAICPRTKETAYPVAQGTFSGVIHDGAEISVPGLGLNGTMLAGMLLAKTDIELRALLDGEEGIVGRMMAEVGVAVEKNVIGEEEGVKGKM